MKHFFLPGDGLKAHNWAVRPPPSGETSRLRPHAAPLQGVFFCIVSIVLCGLAVQYGPKSAEDLAEGAAAGGKKHHHGAGAGMLLILAGGMIQSLQVYSLTYSQGGVSSLL